MGLRDRQKRARQQAILSAAASLFRSKSFEHTTVEEIAAMAELSAGTVFNYYASKVNILLALIEDENAAIVEGVERKKIDLRHSSLDLICDFLGAVAEQSLNLVPPTAWRHVYCSLISDAQSAFCLRFEALRLDLVNAMARLIGHLMAHGRFPPQTDARGLADCIHRIHAAAFVNLISRDDAGFEDYRADIRHHMAVIISLVSPQRS